MDFHYFLLLYYFVSTSNVSHVPHFVYCVFYMILRCQLDTYGCTVYTNFSNTIKHISLVQHKQTKGRANKLKQLPQLKINEKKIKFEMSTLLKQNLKLIWRKY